jgi:hypothetical protein
MTGEATAGAWPRDEAEALKVQNELRALVSRDSVGAPIRAASDWPATSAY